jgi:hypothetical protein
MAKYLPTKVGNRPFQDATGTLASPPHPGIVTRNLQTATMGYQTNNNLALDHNTVDQNWFKLDQMQQSGQPWPKYHGMYLKNDGLDTEGGIFVDNPRNNGATIDFANTYVNYRLDPEVDDSDFGVTLAEGDFLSHKGDLYLKNGGIKYTNRLKFKAEGSATDSAMTLGSNEVYFGKGGTNGVNLTNPNSAQVRIGKSQGTRVEIGCLTSYLNQEAILQIGAAGPAVGSKNSGYIKATQTATTPSPQWNMSFHTYDGTTHHEAMRIDADGSVNIPSIANLIATGPVALGLADAAGDIGDTTIKGNLIVDGGFTYTGSGTVGVGSITFNNVANSGLSLTQNGTGGVVTVTCDVNALNQIPLVTEVTAWNGVVSGSVPAANATALASSRTLWGQEFDGTAAVSGNLTAVGSISSNTNVNLTLSAVNGTSKIKMEQRFGVYHFKSISTTASYGILDFADVTVNRTYTMPDKDGTVAMLSDVSGIGTGVTNTFTVEQIFSGGITGDLTGTASNASKLDGKLPATANTATTIVARDASGNFSAGTITADLTGTASKATKLATARTIGGVSFNGTANITLPGVNTGGTQNTSGNAATATKLATARNIGGVSFNGTANITLPGVNTGGTQNTTGSAATVSGAAQPNITSVGTLTSLSTGAVAVTGAITATGDITAYLSSDERLKDNITPISNALEKVASLSGNTFDWNDKTDKVGSETGVIAQEVQALGLPDVVTERDDGYLAVRYEKLIPLLIEAIKELKAEVEELKA